MGALRPIWSLQPEGDLLRACSSALSDRDPAANRRINSKHYIPSYYLRGQQQGMEGEGVSVFVKLLTVRKLGSIKFQMFSGSPFLSLYQLRLWT